LKQHAWVVYAKKPFAAAAQVVAYLGRYTHRVAISNRRLIAADVHSLTFAYKDYKHPQRPKVATLTADEFLRRFLLHVLPDGFQRIRSYGLLGNRHRAGNLARCRELLAMPVPIPPPERNYRERSQQLTGHDPLRCPNCHRGQMVRIASLPIRGSFVQRCNTS